MANSEDIAAQAALVLNPISFNNDQQFGTGFKEGTLLDQQQPNSNDTDTCEETPSISSVAEKPIQHRTEVNSMASIEPFEMQSSAADVFSRLSHSKEASHAAEKKSIILQPKQTREPEKKGASMKNPSSVRKMISAFESNLVQDTRPHDKPPPPTKSQTSKAKAKAPLHDLSMKEVDAENVKEPIKPLLRKVLVEEPKQSNTNVNKTEERIAIDGAIQSKSSTPILENKSKVHEGMDIKKARKSPADQMRMSTFETASVSGQVTDVLQSNRPKPLNFLANRQDTSETSITTGNGRKTHSKEYSRKVSNDKRKSARYNEDKRDSFEASSTWIFPDDSKPLCTTTSGIHRINAMEGGHSMEAKSHQGRMSFTSVNSEEHCLDSGRKSSDLASEKAVCKLRKSKFESSPEVETSNRPVAQAIKVAIMVGFGVLVLLTRQRKNR